ncbi:MAG: hypothetical protein WDA42_03515 [Candidatus Bathyarchaeia archaeon]
MLNSVCALRVILDKLEPVPQKFKQINSTTTALRSEINTLKQALQAKQDTVAPATVDKLIKDIRDFNAGAVDTALDRHIDKVLSAWLTKNKLKE